MRQRTSKSDDDPTQEAKRILSRLERMEYPVFPLEKGEETKYSRWFATEDMFLRICSDILSVDERIKLFDRYHAIGNNGEVRLPSSNLVRGCFAAYLLDVCGED